MKSEVNTFVLIGLVGVLFLTGCQPEEQIPAATVRSSGPHPQQQIFDYRLIETTAGIRQWILASEEMQKFSGQEDVLLITVKMDFFREGEHFSTLVADSGRANPTTHDIHTWGDVVVQTQDGRRLETQELFFDNQTQLIHNDVFNHFTRDEDVVTGIGLEATPDLEYIEIKQRVAADVSDETGTE